MHQSLGLLLIPLLKGCREWTWQRLMDEHSGPAVCLLWHTRSLCGSLRLRVSSVSFKKLQRTVEMELPDLFWLTKMGIKPFPLSRWWCHTNHKAVRGGKKFWERKQHRGLSDIAHTPSTCPWLFLPLGPFCLPVSVYFWWSDWISGTKWHKIPKAFSMICGVSSTRRVSGYLTHSRITDGCDVFCCRFFTCSHVNNSKFNAIGNTPNTRGEIRIWLWLV